MTTLTSLTNQTLILYHYTKVNPEEWVKALENGSIKSLYATRESKNPFNFSHVITLQVTLTGSYVEYKHGIKGNRFVKSWAVEDNKWFLLPAKLVKVIGIFSYDTTIRV